MEVATAIPPLRPFGAKSFEECGFTCVMERPYWISDVLNPHLEPLMAYLTALLFEPDIPHDMRIRWLRGTLVHDFCIPAPPGATLQLSPEDVISLRIEDDPYLLGSIMGRMTPPDAVKCFEAMNPLPTRPRTRTAYVVTHLLEERYRTQELGLWYQCLIDNYIWEPYGGLGVIIREKLWDAFLESERDGTNPHAHRGTQEAVYLLKLGLRSWSPERLIMRWRFNLSWEMWQPTPEIMTFLDEYAMLAPHSWSDRPEMERALPHLYEPYRWQVEKYNALVRVMELGLMRLRESFGNQIRVLLNRQLRRNVRFLFIVLRLPYDLQAVVCAAVAGYCVRYWRLPHAPALRWALGTYLVPKLIVTSW